MMMGFTVLLGCRTLQAILNYASKTFFFPLGFKIPKVLGVEWVNLLFLKPGVIKVENFVL